MFQAARMVAETLREVIEQHSIAGQQADSAFNATLILGGQIKGGPPRLFLIYPEGNFIEAGADTPFFQIGETKYGRPILVRAYDPAMSFEKAMKLLVVSFDSTSRRTCPWARRSISTSTRPAVSARPVGRIRADDPYYQSVSKGWGDALKDALDSLPDFTHAG